MKVKMSLFCKVATLFGNAFGSGLTPVHSDFYGEIGFADVYLGSSILAEHGNQSRDFVFRRSEETDLFISMRKKVGTN
jgi:hypothetical protein